MHFSASVRQLSLPKFLRVLALSLVGLSGFAQSAFAAAPTISGTPASWVYVGSFYSFTPKAYDSDRQTLKFTISNKPAWASFSSTTGRLSGTPSAVGLWNNIQIRVSDGTTTKSLKAFSLRAVSRSNVAPTISGTPATTAKVGVAYSFQPTAKDSNGDPLVFTIANKPTWASFSSTTGRLSGTPSSSHVGTFSSIVITASDGGKSASTPSFSIKVSASTSTTNRAPTISGTPPTTAKVGTAYSFRPVASDADGDTLGFSIVNKPSWANFSTSTGTLSGTPTTARTHSSVTIKVSDGKATATLKAFTITVSAGSTSNAAPVISGSPARSVNVGSAYSFRPTASDANGDALTFSITNRPTWATFSTTTGQLSGTPTSSHAGTYSNIVIGVSDGKANASLAAFSINVTQSSSGSATLSWIAPTQNTDGTSLTNLAGYRIHYGTSASVLSQTVQVANAGLTTYVLDDLSPGTYYFAVKAYTTGGAESEASNVVSKSVQ
jgi:hypothetical protein